MSREASARGAGNRLRSIIALLRPKQWIKNGFVLAPLLFTGAFISPAATFASFVAVVLFCIASSTVYILNDLVDLERDRRHPIKARTRPLASGAVAVHQAVTLLVVLAASVVAATFWLPRVGGVLLAYLLVNIGYTFYFKHQPVLDIFSIAFGFVLRVYAGAMAIDVPVSGWMFTTTLSLALYLAAIKRRQELSQSGDGARPVLGHYSVRLVERYAEISAAGALIFYSMFVTSSRPELVVTVPLVMFGIFRYWYLVDSHAHGESPTEVVLSDVPLLAALTLWVAACGVVMWSTHGTR